MTADAAKPSTREENPAVWWRRARERAHLIPLVAATTLLMQRAVSGILTKLGHPGAALDDAYIHFQYARAFAEGHPFRFQAGEPISTGATSFLWPASLAPFYLVGFRGEAILWPAWLLSFAALGALAWEAHRLAAPLAGKPAAVGAGAMVLAFGGFIWGAASGMEVVPFAWLMATSLRRAAEWSEREDRRHKRALVELLVFAILCPFMRPEGALITMAIAIVVALYPRRGLAFHGRDLSRLEGLYFAVGALAPNLLLLALTGSMTSSTAQVKLLPGNPYFSVADAAMANARTLVTTILDGQVWSAEFLPKGGAPIALLGLLALVFRAEVTKLRVRGALVLLLALAMFIPCVYVTFLWNRLRYLWPFATGWFVGLACLARVAAALVARIVEARTSALTSALVAGGFAGMLFVRLDWVLEDIAQSASGIDRQQVTLGRWAKTHLPEDVRIGVNDTGAIAYFGDHKTFDVVGLTTPSEGRYWVGGSASRYEHYERLAKTSPDRLPTHFIVYPEWMGVEPVLGARLTEATVTDSTILGGQTMRAMEARWTHLGSGTSPWSKEIGEISDELDVADLDSEGEHAYELLGARDGEEAVVEENAPDGKVVVDGGRTNRNHERFRFHVPAGGRRVLVARVSANQPLTLEARLGDVSLGERPVEPGPLDEVVFEVPATLGSSTATIDVTASAPFASFHYWIGPATP